MNDNFNFSLITDFPGYVSSKDKTNVNGGVLVRGSVNVYKKLSGTIASRPGLKRRGSTDTTLAGVTSSYTWYTSLGKTIPLRVANAKLQFESNIANGTDYVWYDLMTALTATRFVFDPWWDNTEKKDRLVFVKGDSNLHHWSGGFSLLSSGNATTISLVGNSASLTAFVIANSNATSIAVSKNGLVGTSLQAAIALKAQPTNGDTLTLTINGTAVGIQFVTTIGAVAGNVLIGATLADTRTNLLGLLNSPATTNTTQVALSAGNQTLVGYITKASVNSLIKSSTTTWAQDGFYTNTSGDKSLLINGNTYTYTGGEGLTILYGINNDPTGEATGSLVYQSVITEANIPASNFNNDFIRNVGNRIFVGSYTSRIVYISSSTNFKDFVVPTPELVGSPSFVILDSTAKGIGIRQGNAYIGGGLSDWYVVTFPTQTVGSQIIEVPSLQKIRMCNLAAPLAHEFIDMIGDDMVYISQDQQLRMYGTFRNLFQDKFPSLSQSVANELAEENFTGGHLKIISFGTVGDIVYITAPATGHDWMYQIRENIDSQGNIINERFWHPPQVRNVSRFEVIDGVIYGHSNANPQIYQIWDTNQWHDDSPSGEQLGYDCVMRMAYSHINTKNGIRRQGLMSAGKAYFEGYMTTGVNLNANIYENYQGSDGIQQININSNESPAKFFSGATITSLGSHSMGDQPIGDGIVNDPSDQELLPKFRAIPGINPVDVFESSIEVFSGDPDSRWEILALGLNIELSENQAVFLHK